MDCLLVVLLIPANQFSLDGATAGSGFGLWAPWKNASWLTGPLVCWGMGLGCCESEKMSNVFDLFGAEGV